jgi:glycosyltransferase involved in cell wall biosynthesis
MLEEKLENKVLYLHGRPSSHPIHEKLARSLGCDLYPIDKYLRWQDKKRSVLFRVISSILNAVWFPVSSYKLVLVDNLHFAPIIAKLLRFYQKRKYAVHLGSHTLYFMRSNYFSPFNIKLHLWVLSKYDLIICEGKMARQFVEEMLPNRKKGIVTTFIGPVDNRKKLFKKIEYNPTSNQILIIANGPGQFRKYYKGLDIMIKAFEIAAKINSDITLTVLGEWEDEIVKGLLNQVDAKLSNRIYFKGAINSLETYKNYLENSVLLLHCSRGDAFPTSTIEAMNCGIPVLVSHVTGTMEIVEQVSKELITSLNVEDIAERIIRFINFSEFEKVNLSNKFIKVSEDYNEHNSIIHYKRVISDSLNIFI